MVFFVLIFLVLCSGFFSLSQIALFSLSSNELKLYRQDTDRHKQLIASLLDRPRDLLVTLLFCDIAANILIQNTTASFFGEMSSWVMKVGVPLALAVLLGDLIPKTFALPFNARVARTVVPIIAFLKKILGPVRRLLTFITTHLSRILFFFLKPSKGLDDGEIQYILETSETTGVLNHDEAQLVKGYLSLNNHTIKKRMKPRSDILFFDIEEPLTKLVYLFVDKQVSRVPVCRKDLQNLLGILHAKDFFIHRDNIKEGHDLLPFLKRPYYIPETIIARTQLRHFSKTDETMGIVVDEYGSISGLITKEDLLEVIVGEIADPRDSNPLYTPAGKDAVIADGKLEISQFEALFGQPLPSSNKMVTVGGWLTEQLGDIPKSGTTFQGKGFLFHVLASNPQRVQRIYIKRSKT
ncbi:MAG: hemolysin family protein [Chlamydiales bacterium]